MEPAISFQSRLWIIPDRAGFGHAPIYIGHGRAGGAAFPQGDTTLIRVPSGSDITQFDTIGKYRGAQGVPTLPAVVRYSRDLSLLLSIVNRGCDNDVQVHMSDCGDPQNFNKGWQKSLVLEAAVPGDWTTDELGALDPTENKLINETTPFNGERMYEYGQIQLAQVLAGQTGAEITSIFVCDRAQCGACGIASDGCSVIFGTALGAGGSPATNSYLVWTTDAGGSGDVSPITAMGVARPTSLACVGSYVIVGGDDDKLYYAVSREVVLGTETWVQVGDGFVATKAPLAIYSANPVSTWLVGEGGYIYFTADPTSGVVAQSAGSATTNQLNAVHGRDATTIVAVGNTNTVVFTKNGGRTWTSITGPAVGVHLNTVVVKSRNEWGVGAADGNLYYTEDSGDTWHRKGYPGEGEGEVKSIAFATDTVGFMAVTDASGDGLLLRSVDGGWSWYALPEEGSSVPANEGLNKLAVCRGNPNAVFAGGISTGTTGILVKAA